MMYEVKIGNLTEFFQKSMDKVLFSPAFAYFDFVVFYQPRSLPGMGLGLKYIFGKRNFSIKIHIRRSYNNGTESPVCGDCSA